VDFLEMMLHHSVTVLLMSFAYICNYVRIGMIVLVLHDFGDIFSYLIKIVVDTSNTSLKVGSYILLLLSWGGSRLILFPMVIIQLATQEPLELIDTTNVVVMHFFSWVIWCLHVYWYSLFLAMGWTRATTGVEKDIQDQNKKR
jgi:ceramide synthetase